MLGRLLEMQLSVQNRRWWGLVMLTVALLLSSAVHARPRSCKVRRGDTLIRLAKRHGISIDKLRLWNALRDDHIEIGERIHLMPPTKIHRMRKGETVSEVAQREGMKTRDLIAVNPGIDVRRVRKGQKLHIPVGGAHPEAKEQVHRRTDTRRRRAANKRQRDKEKARSVAKKRKLKRARRGSSTPRRECLSEMAKVPHHIGYRRVSRHARFATVKTNEALRRGFDYVLRHHRLAPRVDLMDASREDNGDLSHHRSHQEGRDVDIAYYQRRCPRSGCRGRTVTPKNLDVKRQWTLLRYWIKQGDAELMFVDYGLQEKLYREAKKRGASARQLKEWFQYPRSPRERKGIIRHWSGHKNHVHVRFYRPRGKQRNCR
ncbi:MAG: LysM peptidoglycan-binding domain-containing protein [Myxococcota bacterium]